MLRELEESLGYVPGLIGAIATLHADYYSKHWNFDHFFEGKVATELSTFVNNYDSTKDRLWSLAQDGRIQASIAIDGTGERDAIAHLRWFIVAEHLHGSGAGNRLLQNAIAFCRELGYATVYLSTFRGLEPARHLYEKYDFELVAETTGKQWGPVLTEQRFELELARGTH